MWNLILLPDPREENENNKPITLVDLLNTNRLKLKEKIPRLDTNSFINMKELDDNIPEWDKKPSVIENGRTISNITFSASLNRCGTIYVII